MENETSPIEAAQEMGTFDVLAFLDNASYPKEKVVVYTDAAGAAEYVKLNEKRHANKDEELDAALTAKIEEVGKRITESAIIFELMGLSPEEVELILKPDAEDTPDSTEATLAKEDTLAASSIVSMSNYKGVKDPNPATVQTITRFRSKLKEGEFGKLLRGVASVNFNAALFDRATDAGFSGGSLDVAE